MLDLSLPHQTGFGFWGGSGGGCMQGRKMLGDIRVYVCRRAWETCVIFELNSILFTQG